MSHNKIFDYKTKIDCKLIEIIDSHNAPEILKEAMRYSLASGGKRIRPCLMLEFYRVLGGNPDDILGFACAVEMIHTYSLIHDDLPCMDDDNMRRGKPSNHIAFGEANALLAGDALLTLAFETAADINENIDANRAVKAIKHIADAAGMCKMVGGQVLDLESEGKEISLKKLEKIQEGKTVAMLKVNALVAGVLAGADDKTLALMSDYCEKIGRAFQIRDDILDVIGTKEELGKPIGSDVEMEKNTYVSLLGLERSQMLVEELTKDAVNSIKKAFADCDNLKELALSLEKRKK